MSPPRALEPIFEMLGEQDVGAADRLRSDGEGVSAGGPHGMATGSNSFATGPVSRLR